MLSKLVSRRNRLSFLQQLKSQDYCTVMVSLKIKSLLRCFRKFKIYATIQERSQTFKAENCKVERLWKTTLYFWQKIQSCLNPDEALASSCLMPATTLPLSVYLGCIHNVYCKGGWGRRGKRIFFKGAKFFHIPPHHREFFVAPFSTRRRKWQPPPPYSVLTRKVE